MAKRKVSPTAKKNEDKATASLRKATSIGPLDPKQATSPEQMIRAGIDDPFAADYVTAMIGEGGMAGALRGNPAQGREMTRLMLELMDEGKVKEAFKVASQRFPRIMGNVREISQNWPKGIWNKLTQRGSEEMLPGSGYESTINVSPINKLFGQKGVDETVGHEITHSAQQAIEGKDLERRYAEANRLFGYNKNPYEMQANRMMEPFQGKAKEVRKRLPKLDMKKLPMAEFAPVSFGQYPELSLEEREALKRLLDGK